MPSPDRQIYLEASRHLQDGGVTQGAAEMDFVELKPHFYADAHRLAKQAATTFEELKVAAPPYGLLDRTGQPAEAPLGKSAIRLESALMSTMRHIFSEITPPACPYYGALDQRLGREPQPETASPDRDTLRDVVARAATLAATTTVHIARRVPAAAAFHGATAPTEAIMRNSMRPLLREPLSHPQQWAKAFNFALAPGSSDMMLNRANFLDDATIARYTKLGEYAGKQAITWSIPTENFIVVTNEPFTVTDRVNGSENRQTEHDKTYNPYTRLNKIEVNEPVIGCAGVPLAYAMYQRAVDVILAEDIR